MNDIVKKIESVIRADVIRRLNPGVSAMAFCPETGSWVFLNCDPYPELYEYTLIRLPTGWSFKSST